MERLTDDTSRVRLRRMTPPTRVTDLVVQEIDALRREAALRDTGYCAKTVVRGMNVRTVLFAMRGGTRMREDRARGGVLIRVLAGHLELHVGKTCGDEWDMLPYVIRHTEGACGFFSLDDDTIALPVGSLLALDPSSPNDVEAVEDSAFILDVRTDIVH